MNQSGFFLLLSNGLIHLIVCSVSDLFLSMNSLTRLSVVICTVWGRCEYLSLCVFSQLPFILGWLMQAVT